VLAALAVLRPKEAVQPLIASLADLRLRPYVAQTLASIGHPAARAPLGEWLATERHKDTRSALAAALVELGAKSELAAPLLRFLGTPDPLPDGVDLARRAGLLSLLGTTDQDLGRLRDAPASAVPIRFKTPLLGPRKPAGAGDATDAAAGYRLLARGASTDGSLGRLSLSPCDAPDPRWSLEFPDGSPRELFLTLPTPLAPAGRGVCIAVTRTPNLRVEGIAIVPLADELPPPPPEPWEAGPAAASSAGLTPNAPGTFH
jgi:hypothetical protein